VTEVKVVLVLVLVQVVLRKWFQSSSSM